MLIWRDNNYHIFPALLGIRLLYLSLCEVQVDGDLVAAEPGQVVVVGELGLQLPQLLLGERRALFPGLAAGVHLKTGLLDICRETERERVFVRYELCLTAQASLRVYI